MVEAWWRDGSVTGGWQALIENRNRDDLLVVDCS